MLKLSPKTVVLKEDINALNTMIVELGESGSVVDNYSDLVGKTQTLTVVVKDYIALVDAANNNDKNSVEHLLQNVIQHLPKFSENEKTWSLLTGKYKFTAWFSLGLALFFDLCSLMAGLFRFWIQKKEVPKSYSYNSSYHTVIFTYPSLVDVANR